MVKSAFLCGGSALAVAASLYGTQAMAATANAADTASAAGVGTVGELVVIAQKREQKIESVPVAITAFSGKERDILGIKTTQDLSDFTPGLSYYSIADRAYIRGIGRNTVNLATASGVATYYDGIYYGANATIAEQHDSLFIGNIEVDRGPQNTLHGSNADGGVINYTSQHPSHDLSAELRGGIQSYGYHWAEGVINVPLSDDWRVQVGGNFSEQKGGYFKNLIGPPEGGSGPQGNGGEWHYAEGQIEGSIGHLDVWAKASSGEYDTNFHTVATIGAVSNYEFPSGGLFPSTFFGLCGLPNTNVAQCTTVVPAAFLPPGAPAGSANQTVVPGSQVAVFTNGVLANQFPGDNPSTANPHRFIETSTQNNTQNDNVALALNLTYHFPSFDVTYTGGYQSFYYQLYFGPGVDSGLASYQIAGPPGLGNLTIFPSNGDGTLFIEDDSYFSHELTFTSTDKGPFQWIAGAYWYHEKFNQPVGLQCYPNQPQMKAPAGAPPNPAGCAINVDGNLKYDDYAGYAHGSYKFTDQWNFAGGVRYTYDHKYGFEGQRIVEFDDPFLAPAATGATAPFLGSFTPALDITGGANAAFLPGGAFGGKSSEPGVAGVASINATNGFIQRTLNDHWSAWTGDATINWTPTPATLAYFRYARGYKAGGFNAGSFNVTPSTGAEGVDQFELGLKQTVGSVLVVNAAVFYYNYQNDQQPLGVVNPNTNTVLTQIFNIPNARIDGLELEGSWKPIDPATLTFEYSYLDAKVTNMGGACVLDSQDPFAVLPGDNISGCGKLANGNQPQNLVGATLPESPKNKVAFNGQYAFHFEPGTLTLSASYIWKDRTFGSIFNRPLSLAPSYSTVNLSATFDDAKQRFTLIAFVNNVFNTTGFDNVTETNNAQAGTPLQLLTARGLTAPLTFGGEVQFRFR